MSKSLSPNATQLWWQTTAKTMGLSLLLAVEIQTFVAEARLIPSGAMFAIRSRETLLSFIPLNSNDGRY